VALCVASVARPVGACGATADPEPVYWTLEGVSFAGGDPAALDGALVVRGASDSFEPANAAEFGRLVIVTVTKSGDATPVRGHFVSTQYTREPAAIWRADAPLEPNAHYVATIDIPSLAEPTGAAGVEELAEAFVTGTDAMAPLELDGEIDVWLEETDAPEMTCELVGCGYGNCREVGRRPALIAHVTLPAISGGWSPLGYWSWHSVTDRAPYIFPNDSSPHDVVLGGWEVLSDESITREVEFPPESGPYRACLAFQVEDALEGVVQTNRCFDVFEEAGAQPAAAAPGDVAAKPGSSRPRGGCSAAPGRAASRAWLGALVAAACWMLGRRRSSSARRP
jgi:hypothetical protein